MRRYLAIVAVIVVAAVLAWQQSQQPSSAVDAPSQRLLQQWPQITPAAITSITIRHNSATIDLHRNAHAWMVADQYGSAAANEALVAQLLKSVTNMRPQRVVSSNPNNFARFRVTDNGADRLTLKGDKSAVLLDIWVGKAGVDLISTTIRQVGANAIINVNRSLAWQLGKPAASWRKDDQHPTPKGM
ncbi:MAG: DUF4340 domain-containing protein [Mariprofundales bacterium]